MIRLTEAKDRRYRGTFHYLIAYDYSSGNNNRYTVLVLNSDDPVVIGRELPLDTVRDLIADYEEEAKKLECWIGERKDVLAVKNKVIAERKKKYNVARSEVDRELRPDDPVRVVTLIVIVEK